MRETYFHSIILSGAVVHCFLLIHASCYCWCWVPMTAHLGSIINVWVTEAGCAEYHSELSSALQKTEQDGYARVPWSRSWLEKEVPGIRKVSKGQEDAVTSRSPSTGMFPRAESLVFDQLWLASSLKMTKFSFLPVCNSHVIYVTGWAPTPPEYQLFPRVNLLKGRLCIYINLQCCSFPNVE